MTRSVSRSFSLLLTFVLFVTAAFASGCSRFGGGEDATPTPLFPTPAAGTSNPPGGRPTPVPPTPTATEDPMQGTLTVWHSWDEPDMPVLLEIIEAFQAEYPNLLFDVLYVPAGDLPARFSTAAQENRGPLLVLAPAQWGSNFYDLGLVADLTDLATPGLLESLNPAAVDGGRYQDAQISLPYSVQGVVLYRNARLFFEAPETLEDLIQFSRATSQGEVQGAYLDRSFLYSGAHLQGLGGELMTPDGLPAFNNEKGLAWIEMLKRFETAGPTALGEDQDLEWFKNGRAGMIIDGTWNRQAIVEALGGSRVTIDPWPAYGDGYLAGYVQSEQIFISASATPPQQQAAWAFIEFFLSPASQSKLAGLGRIPALKEVELKDITTDPLLPKAMQALAGGVPYPTHPNTALYLTAMDTALRNIFTAKMDPAQALQLAEEAVLNSLAGVTPTPQP